MLKKIFLITIIFLIATSFLYAENLNEKLISYAWQGDLNKLKSLFVNINYKNSRGQTALYAAACQGNLEIVKFLVAKGAKIDAIDKNGATPLMCAVWNKHFKTAKYLLDKGADPKHKDKWGNTAEKQLLYHLKKGNIK